MQPFVIFSHGLEDLRLGEVCRSDLHWIGVFASFTRGSVLGFKISASEVKLTGIGIS
jgi:hypothetical protein